MTKVEVFVGLDYHQDQVQVCVLDEAGKVLVNRATHCCLWGQSLA